MVESLNIPDPPAMLPGIVTVKEWTMAADGLQYRHFWGDWRESDEGDKRAMMAVVEGKVEQSFPISQVAGWSRCASPPAYIAGRTDCYIVKAT